MSPVDHRRDLLAELLEFRRDRRFREGVLQTAVSLGVISHPEWERLSASIADPKLGGRLRRMRGAR